MNLYVVRHGETNENVTGMMQGKMETVLNENGKNQALTVKNKIDNLDIDIIISSPRKRTLETASIISDNRIPIIVDERLRSRDHGEFQGLSRDEVDIHDYWNIKKNNKYKEAESVRHLYDRIDEFIKEIKIKYSNKNVLIVTHSAVCRILYFYFNGVPEDGDLINGYESTTCSLEKYELEEIYENIIS